MKKHKGISRTKTGWFARVYFRKRIYSRSYCDNYHGGSDIALAKAIYWRIQKVEELNSKYKGIPISKIPRSNTGIVGVTRTHKEDRLYYSASCQINRKQKCKSFSISKYGEIEALRLACEWREKNLNGNN